MDNKETEKRLFFSLGLVRMTVPVRWRHGSLLTIWRFTNRIIIIIIIIISVGATGRVVYGLSRLCRKYILWELY